MIAYRESTGTAPVILMLGNRWASEAVWAFWRREKVVLLPGFEPQITHPVP
jgi:hypothetical protein